MKKWGSTTLKTMMNKPTTGNKVLVDGYWFDSQKEALFYELFVKDSGYRFEVHKPYRLHSVVDLDGARTRSLKYTPDFVLWNTDGSYAHVYDVKNDLSTYGLNAAARLRMTLFTGIYKQPVECVVPRRNGFKVGVPGLTTARSMTKDPLEVQSVDYDWHMNLRNWKQEETE